jgi:hypothetical protein
LTSPSLSEDAKVYYLATPWNAANDGFCQVVDIVPGIVAVGTDTGAVLVFSYEEAKHTNGLKRYLRIPPPPAGGLEVVSVRVSVNDGVGGSDANANANANAKASIFVAYRRSNNATVQMSTAGICCYDMPLPSGGANSSASISGPSARHDLDGRYVGSPSLVDAVQSSSGMQMTVVRI